MEQIALPMAEANPFQAILSTSTKPETVSNLTGPTRFDPDLGSAPVSVGVLSPTDTVGPPSTVMSGRDAALVGNQPPQLYDTMDTSSLAFIHDRQEVKHTIHTGTTVLCFYIPRSRSRPDLRSVQIKSNLFAQTYHVYM